MHVVGFDQHLLKRQLFSSHVNAHVFPELCHVSRAIYEFAGCVIEKETDYLGNDIEELQKLRIPYGVKNQQACAALTATKEGALFWTYRASDKKCWIKTSKKGKRAHKGLVSGNIECGKCLTNASVFQDLINTCPKFSCSYNVKQQERKNTSVKRMGWSTCTEHFWTHQKVSMNKTEERTPGRNAIEDVQI